MMSNEHPERLNAWQCMVTEIWLTCRFLRFWPKLQGSPPLKLEILTPPNLSAVLMKAVEIGVEMIVSKFQTKALSGGGDMLGRYRPNPNPTCPSHSHSTAHTICLAIYKFSYFLWVLCVF